MHVRPGVPPADPPPAVNHGRVGPWPTGPTSQNSYGGPGELWGVTWTPAEINAVDFGSALSVKWTGTGAVAFIDFGSIEVYYTDCQ